MGGGWKDTVKEVLPLAVISYIFTGLRLTGQLLGWSESWFSRTASGLIPVDSVSWVVGITWLAFPFGGYLAWKLVRSGSFPRAPVLSLAYAVIAALVLLGGQRLVPMLSLEFQPLLVTIWGIAVLAAVIAWIGWPDLGRHLLAYGLMSRIAVVVTMLLAMHGRWGTHYDYAGIPRFQEMSFWPKFFWLAFFPQLLFWVGFTVTAGILAGALTALVLPKMREPRQ